MNNIIINKKLRKAINYTYTSVKTSMVRCRNCFLFLNDKRQQLEMHYSRTPFSEERIFSSYNTLLATIPYESLINKQISYTYDKNGIVSIITIGSHHTIEFVGLHKETSHHHSGDGLYNIKEGFRYYKKNN